MNAADHDATHDAIIVAPFGALGVRVAGGCVCEIEFLPPGTAPRKATDPVAIEAARQIAAYLADPDFRFDLPLATAGTPFRNRVWQEMLRIPRGQTRTYGDLAAILASAPRAVGGACGANPYPLAVPCHRVVARHGAGGFAHARNGWLIDTKNWLLAHERI